MLNKGWFKAALARAIKTIFQTFVSLLIIDSTLYNIDLPTLPLIAIFLLSGVLSMVTSVVTKLPEVNNQGSIYISETEEKTVLSLNLGVDLEDLAKRKNICISINDLRGGDSDEITRLD